MQYDFEHWFLSINDVDETLLDKDETGKYKDDDINFAYASFCAGVRSCHK